MKRSLLSVVYIGKAKGAFFDLYQDKYIVSFGGYRIGIQDVELWKERHLIKIPEKYRGQARSVIFADKNIPKPKLLEVTERIFETGDHEIYLALQNNGEKFDIKLLTLYPDTYREDIDAYF